MLALSDIHNNLVAVRRLRATEKNSFNAIVVAGDLGNETAKETLRILSTFNCSVLYVFGNWDSELEYKRALVPGCRLIHQNVVTIDGWHFTGFSGCPTKWGNNPIALEHRADKFSEILKRNREILSNTIADKKPNLHRTVVVSHERLTRLDAIAPGVRLHIHGHIHSPSVTTMKQSTIVNVSVLDKPMTVRPQRLHQWDRKDFRNINNGNYTIFEMSNEKIDTKFVSFKNKYRSWVTVREERHNGIEWIPEELKWVNPNDPPLLRYWVSNPTPTRSSPAALTSHRRPHG